jgi:hypothetical protein
MESVYLLGHSKDIEVLIGRHVFLIETSNELYRYKLMNPNRFSFDVEQAISDYKQMYYDHKITQAQTFIAYHPDKNNNADMLFKMGIVNAVIKTYKDQCNAVKIMKRKSAIDNRKKKFSEFIETARGALLIPKNQSGVDQILLTLQRIDEYFSNDKFDEIFNVSYNVTQIQN